MGAQPVKSFICHTYFGQSGTVGISCIIEADIVVPSVFPVQFGGCDVHFFVVVILNSLVVAWYILLLIKQLSIKGQELIVVRGYH